MRRYVNTPSAFLTPRDYYPNYDDLAAIKTTWDADEVFRIYLPGHSADGFATRCVRVQAQVHSHAHGPGVAGREELGGIFVKWGVL